MDEELLFAERHFAQHAQGRPDDMFSDHVDVSSKWRHDSGHGFDPAT